LRRHTNRSRVTGYSNQNQLEIQRYEPDIIEKDLCLFFSPEWLEHPAKETRLIKEREK